MIHQMILTEVERVTLQAQLDDAVLQYHALATGQQARVILDQNGERVEFTAANIGRLSSYITRLRMQLAPPCDRLTMVAPARFIF